MLPCYNMRLYNTPPTRKNIRSRRQFYSPRVKTGTWLINLKFIVEGWNSLEQYIGFEVRLAFNYYCSLHQV